MRHLTKAESVTDAISGRRSVRAYLTDTIPDSTIRAILANASRAPSGTNMQPWQVYVVTGAKRNQLCDAVCNAFDHESAVHDSEVRYYPEQWFEPFISRRRKVGWDLYQLLGIAKGEREKTRLQHRRNFQFFDAPIGLLFTINRNLATGSWLDYGMFLQNIMLLAREQDLDTCPQAAWADYHRVIRTILPIADEETVVCGMSIGYADQQAVENTLVTEREEIDRFTSFFS